jgi:hypothetical protein
LGGNRAFTRSEDGRREVVGKNLHDEEKPQCQIIDGGWEFLEEGFDGIWCKESLEVVLDYAKSVARPITVIAKRGNDKCYLPLLEYPDVDDLLTPHWYFPFLRASWFTTEPELLLVAEKFANEFNFTIDALDIQGLDERFPRGTPISVMDIREDLASTLAQYPKGLRKKIRREFKRNKVEFRPSTIEEEYELLTYWIRMWNGIREPKKSEEIWFQLLQIWRANGVPLHTESVYVNGELVGLYVMMFDTDGIAYGFWTVWFKEKYKSRYGLGYMVKHRQMEVCVEKGYKVLELGSLFGSESKERWSTRIIRYGAIGTGFREVQA